MRILVAIPHFHHPDGREAHGSLAADAERRVEALTACVQALHRTFGSRQIHITDSTARCNRRFATSVDIVVCTTGGHHVLDRSGPLGVAHRSTDAKPLLLGYECHAVLAENVGRYDCYAYVEDDLVIEDPLFFSKIAWFSGAAGRQAVLQPSRFEVVHEGPVHKLYIDGPLMNPTISPKFQDRSIRPRLTSQFLGQTLEFDRVDNPHSGCFFLSEAQMQHWMAQPWFMDRAADFWGPLESAATLGLMRTFQVYKPTPANAGFLEIRHADTRYLGKQVRFS